MELRLVCAIGIACWPLACSDRGASDRPNATLEPPVNACTDVGPACGLVVEIEDGGLGLGLYSIRVTTAAGVTACDITVEPTRFQTPAEAREQDAFLSTCAAQGTCPPEPCTGPDTVYLGSDAITIPRESSMIAILIEDVETGAQASKTFSPDYRDHPERTAQCHMCRVASDSMPAPE